MISRFLILKIIKFNLELRRYWVALVKIKTCVALLSIGLVLANQSSGQVPACSPIGYSNTYRYSDGANISLNWSSASSSPWGLYSDILSQLSAYSTEGAIYDPPNSAYAYIILPNGRFWAGASISGTATCPSGYQLNQYGNNPLCYPISASICPSLERVTEKPPACGDVAGNPIAIYNQNKFDSILLYQSRDQKTRLFYSSNNSDIKDINQSLVWSFDQQSSIKRVPAANGALFDTMQVFRADGGRWIFNQSSTSSWAPASRFGSSLLQLPGNTGWIVSDGMGTLETYGQDGKMSAQCGPAGMCSTLSWNGQSLSMTDPYGRLISVLTDSKGRIVSITDSAGRTPSLNFISMPGAVTISWPDSSVKTLLLDESSQIIGGQNTGSSRSLLTGVLDEVNQRFATYRYDQYGNALETSHGTGVDKWTVSNISDAQRLVRGPNNSESTIAFTTIAGKPVSTTRSQPAGSGCSASTSAQSYDANGNLASRDDFNGYRTCYANDLSRNLETARVEGLAGGASCAVTASGTALPAGGRKVSTQWHPDWSLAIRQAEPGRITISVYNGQPDPFAGGSVASCAPTRAMLPGGKRIAVLCRQVEQATTDVDGSQSFAAQGQAGVASREQRWIYNQLGQVLSATDALGKTTTYAYYAATAFGGADPNAVGHTMGDLQSVTNPAGHVTQYALYNKAGQAVQMVDPNGVGTVYQYDARQRLTSIAVGGLTTFYEYWPTGLLKKATQPDGSYLSYGYDDAHRLVQVSDNLGNSIIYTLDSMGNRTTETVMDAGGSLRSQLSRSIDALGRIQQVTGSP